MLESRHRQCEHNQGADIDTLKVTTVYVDKGPSLSASPPVPRGRGNRIVKPATITLTVGN